MSEGEKRFDLVLVSPSIAHEDVFLILLVNYLSVAAPCSGICSKGMRTILIQALHPREWQFAARIGIANEN